MTAVASVDSGNRSIDRFDYLAHSAKLNICGALRERILTRLAQHHRICYSGCDAIIGHLLVTTDLERDAICLSPNQPPGCTNTGRYYRVALSITTQRDEPSDLYVVAKLIRVLNLDAGIKEPQQEESVDDYTADLESSIMQWITKPVGGD
jgi:hypothetical protein